MQQFRKEKNRFYYLFNSDIQGNDLNVLKTLSFFIKNKKIGSISCETAKNEYETFIIWEIIVSLDLKNY